MVSMRIAENLPHAVREIPNLWIPLPDGSRLAARLWLPAEAEEQPVPCILEYIPYRQNDLFLAKDAPHHRWFAGHGYASLRVDLRGSGDSDGVLTDEYLAQELQDGVEVIDWIARQPWCSGAVGMIGISWGGFNGLQIAALRPPALKAVISVCSTDDRYADDVHYMGGCLLLDNLNWGAVMFAHNALPPTPEVVGEGWRDTWLARLENAGLWAEKWMRRQRRDAYWKHGSVCEDYAAIQCPVYAVGGWADGYSNAILRLLAGLEVPRKGLIGPWAHRYPHLGEPGPAIGFLQEAKRWWDHWLKGVATGIMDEPMLRAWMQDPAPPQPRYESRPGRWVAEASWPSGRSETWSLGLAADGSLVEEGASCAAEAAPLGITSPLRLGIYGGKWCSYAVCPDLPHDQRFEDGGALVFETTPLEQDIELLGQPVVELAVSADRPAAQVVVRLSDVHPDGSVTRTTYGVLNLTHRDGHERPQPLTPGEVYRVEVKLNDLAQRFAKGHRLRLSISSSYWPVLWPSPEPVELTVRPAECRLRLPVRPPRAEDAALPPFEEPEAARGPALSNLEPGRAEWRIAQDLASDVLSLEVDQRSGRLHLEEAGLTVVRNDSERYALTGNRLDSLAAETRGERALVRGDWAVRAVARQRLTATAECFRIEAELEAFEGDERVFHKTWDERIPRDGV